MVFVFNFWNFFAIFLEFSISRRVGTKRHGTIIIIFSLSRPFQTYFAWKEAIVVFFNFLNFFAIFLEFSITRRVGTERTGPINFFFFLHLVIFQPFLAWNEAIMVYFNFLNFFASLLEFSITRRVGMERTDNFYFFSFSAFSNLFYAWNEGRM